MENLRLSLKYGLLPRSRRRECVRGGESETIDFWTSESNHFITQADRYFRYMDYPKIRRVLIFVLGRRWKVLMEHRYAPFAERMRYAPEVIFDLIRFLFLPVFIP